MEQLQATAIYPNVTTENLAQFKELVAQTLELAKGEPATLQYDWFCSEDQTRWLLRETYESSDAVLVHLGGVASSPNWQLPASRSAWMTSDAVRRHSDTSLRCRCMNSRSTRASSST